MINISKDIHSLTEFKRNTTEFLQRIKQTKHPLILTVNGKAELVVQDAESYQELLDAAELVETLKEIKLSLAQMQPGQGIKAEEFFQELEQEIHDLLPKRYKKRDEVLARIRQRVEALPIEAEIQVQAWKSAEQT
ncbi:type II toxin-antitoxin system Phd/YefM family antitoxin [Nostoc sp. FACHB-110]|uniref:type II toxin-antitoxin system Phd/YefM family antitoxin n=1 Tax=Nostoc sp. FACHB-110 TaxID=2692834 RepID=UPI0016858FF7|nr:type II toxin-antitoxin system Phd/YefM family antitoxin [Nostoc sp. FACHB-110]MBD2437877.1 type II toxin-antitoxin system Phd/YefM family antitoxin [Nostoc sp. FACHB-110]